MTIIRKEFPVKGRKRPVVKYRYAVTYKDPFGESHRKYSKWFLSQKEAEAAQAEFKASPITSGVKLSFLKLANECIEDKRSRVSDRTYKEQKRRVETWFKPLHNLSAYDITPMQIKRVLEPYESQYATRTMNKAFNTLKSIFDYGTKFYDLPRNPMSKLSRYQLTEEEKMHEMTIWDPDQFEMFMAAIPEDKQIYATFFHVLFYTGLRKNEALSLTWDDFDGSQLNIWRQWERGRWKSLKTRNSKRKVLLDPETIKRLTELKKSAQKDERFKNSWFIFGDMKPMGTTEIDRIKAEAIKAAGVPYIRIHDLRHSHASYLISKGVNMVTVSRRLGHASIQMTIDQYTHLLSDAQDEVIKAIME